MSDVLRIGTRKSPLAIWQAEYVKDYLSSIGVSSELVFIDSEGEKNLISPLYEMGVQGIFTKTLDIALLENKIDLAVHSLKDVPTAIPNDLFIACIPPRGNASDTLVFKEMLPGRDIPFHVATSSLRRKTQWLNKYPKLHHTESVRGNINTRLQKFLDNEQWDGIIFASAGLERIQLNVPQSIELDWMIPAPAQGALGVVVRKKDLGIAGTLQGLHCSQTSFSVGMERAFLRGLEGGCSLPLGCHVQAENGAVFLKACLLDPSGELKISFEREFRQKNADTTLIQLIKEVKTKEIFPEIRKRLGHE